METRRSGKLKSTDETSVKSNTARMKRVTAKTTVIPEKPNISQATTDQLQVVETVILSSDALQEDIKVDTNTPSMLPDTPPTHSTLLKNMSGKGKSASSIQAPKATPRSTTRTVKSPPPPIVSTVSKPPNTAPVELTLKCEPTKSDSVTVTPVAPVKIEAPETPKTELRSGGDGGSKGSGKCTGSVGGQQRGEEELPSFVKRLDLSDVELLSLATKLVNVVYRGATGGSGEQLPDDFLERIVTAAIVLQRKQQCNVVYLLAAALAAMQVNSEHLPIESHAFNVVQLIVRALHGSGAGDFHASVAGEAFAQWLGEACSMAASTEEFLDHFSALLFPWGMHRYAAAPTHDHEDTIMLQVDAQYVATGPVGGVQEDCIAGLPRPRMGLIMMRREQEIARLLRKAPPHQDHEEGLIHGDSTMESFNDESNSNAAVSTNTNTADYDTEGNEGNEDSALDGNQFQEIHVIKAVDVTDEFELEEVELLELSANKTPGNSKKRKAEEETEDDEEIEDDDSSNQSPMRKSKRTKHSKVARLEFERYPCDICGKKFTLKKLRDDHIITEHGAQEGGTYKCYLCDDDTLTTEQQLREHVDRHKRTCKICGFVIPQGFKMKSHLTFHRDKGTCQFCKQEFGTRWEMRVHVYETHADIKPYACDECKIRFTHENALADHVAVYHRKEQNLKYDCQDCKQKFPFYTALEKHKQRFHSRIPDEKRHPCDLCDKLFRSPLNVQHHKRKAHGLQIDMSVRCVYCPADAPTFPTRHQLNRHKASEHPSQPMIVFCTDCTATFPSQRELLQHYVAVHESQASAEAADPAVASFQCYACDKAFATDLERSNHAKIIHGETKVFQCHICSAIFRSKYGFENHINQHTAPKQVLCEECGKAFDSRRNCERHRQLQHERSLAQRRKEKRFPCRFCPQRFTDRGVRTVHEQRKHLGNASYARQPCAECAMSFCNAGALKKHMETVHLKLARRQPSRTNCPVCAKTLAANSLKEHMQHAHGLGRTAYQCSHCKRYFKTLDNLQQHCDKPMLCTKKRKRVAEEEAPVTVVHPTQVLVGGVGEEVQLEEVVHEGVAEVGEAGVDVGVGVLMGDGETVMESYTLEGSEAVVLDGEEVQVALDPHTHEYYIVSST